MVLAGLGVYWHRHRFLQHRALGLGQQSSSRLGMLVVELPMEPLTETSVVPPVLKELHTEQVRCHVPKLSPNAGHRVEVDAVAVALLHIVCMFFAG